MNFFKALTVNGEGNCLPFEVRRAVSHHLGGVAVVKSLVGAANVPYGQALRTHLELLGYG